MATPTTTPTDIINPAKAPTLAQIAALAEAGFDIATLAATRAALAGGHRTTNTVKG